MIGGNDPSAGGGLFAGGLLATGVLSVGELGPFEGGAGGFEEGPLAGGVLLAICGLSVGEPAPPEGGAEGLDGDPPLAPGPEEPEGEPCGGAPPPPPPEPEGAAEKPGAGAKGDPPPRGAPNGELPPPNEDEPDAPELGPITLEPEASSLRALTMNSDGTISGSEAARDGAATAWLLATVAPDSTGVAAVSGPGSDDRVVSA